MIVKAFSNMGWIFERTEEIVRIESPEGEHIEIPIEAYLPSVMRLISLSEFDAMVKAS